MESDRTTRLLDAEALMDWRARHIGDPLDRLKYLKAATWAPRDSGARHMRFAAHWRPVVPLFILALTTSYLVSKAASRGDVRRAVAAATATSRPSVRRQTAAASAVSIPDVWLVEQTATGEQYSNGLLIDNRLAIPNRPRSYAVFDASHPESSILEWRTEPAGIVLHTTESDQAPFEPLHNRDLKSITENLLEYVRNRRAYNFLIDRFGRVHRLVLEKDAANHAGHSVWADEKWLYLNLNDSFLGVSFEAQTKPSAGDSSITPAQVRAGALLIEMLRARYHLPAGNCITHAQASVNPANMRIGYHTDFAARFPFGRIGLPDNYASPLASVYLCGFVCDRSYVASTGSGMLPAISLSEQRLAEEAALRRMAASSFREFLQKEYRKKVTALRKHAPEGDAS